MRILLAGASGMIGSEVARRIESHEVRRLVRREAAPGEYRWDPVRGIVAQEAIEWADAVISLSGASLSRLPWTRRYRRVILRSRTESVATLAAGIARAVEPPAVWVSGSAVGIYGDRPGELLTEQSDPGTGFLAEVVRAWEDATAPAAARTRIVHARTGLVLAGEGALTPLILATRLGAGATVGDGRQHWPWIALADEARALIHLATDSELSGPVNLTSPEAATSEDVTRAVAAVLHRPHRLRLPGFALRAAMGMAAQELLLADQRVIPDALIGDGFAFEAATLADAARLAITPR